MQRMVGRAWNLGSSRHTEIGAKVVRLLPSLKTLSDILVEMSRLCRRRHFNPSARQPGDLREPLCSNILVLYQYTDISYY